MQARHKRKGTNVKGIGKIWFQIKLTFHFIIKILNFLKLNRYHSKKITKYSAVFLLKIIFYNIYHNDHHHINNNKNNYATSHDF